MLVEVLSGAITGLVAGILALAVGGVGVLLQLRRQVGLLALAVDDVNERVTSEVKRRAGHEGGRRSAADLEMLEAMQNVVRPRLADRPSRREILDAPARPWDKGA